MSSTFAINRAKKVILASVVILFAIALILYPTEAVKSSLHGLRIWWNVIFPTLLPFFIAVEMMMGLGVVHVIGILLEPLMRPVFRVPGVGGFVMAVGVVSGNPMGAKLSAELREQKLITREEGERLVSITSNAGPLFIIGAVAVGFFENAAVGMLLALAHYLGGLLVGLLMRFHKYQTPIKTYEKVNIRAILYKIKPQIEKPFGKMLGDAVTSSISTLLMIGGFIMLFAVITHLITHSGITAMLSHKLGVILNLMSVPNDLTNALITGIFEMTLGTQMVTSLPSVIPMVFKLTAVSLLIGFSGLSVHAQVASFLARTDMSYKPYFIARLLHAIIAAIITFAAYPFFKQNIAASQMSTSVMIGSFFDKTQVLFGNLKAVAITIMILWAFAKIKSQYTKFRAYTN